MVDFAKVKRPARERVRILLSDLRWHSYAELHTVGGIRYSARLLELKRLGYDIDTVGDKEVGLRYRLISNTPGKPQEKRVKVFLTRADAAILLLVAKQSMPDAAEEIEGALRSFDMNAHKL